MVVGIKDIAAYVGLSTSTVSRALNGYDDVAVDTVRRVQQAAGELGYYPSASARNLRCRRTEKIGLALLFDSAFATYNEFFAELIRLVAAAANRHDTNVVLYTHAGEDPSELTRIAQTREVDGLLVLGDMPGLDAALRRCQAAGMPFVILARMVDDPRMSCVSMDYQEAARLALSHLVGLGHRRIAYISFSNSSRYSRDRTACYSSALAELGLRYDARLVAYASLQPGSGAQAMEALLALDEPPTAVYLYNDRLAIEVLQHLGQREVRVPQEVALVGFDDIRSARMTNPSLTTVRYSLDMIAEQAVCAVLQQRAEPGAPPVRRVLPVELVVRQSTMGHLRGIPFESLEWPPSGGPSSDLRPHGAEVPASP
jgi:LacI family transcriptional regulator